MFHQEPIRFSNHGIPFLGTLHLPAGKGPFPVLVLMHSASNPRRDDPAYRHLAELLPANGIAVFLFDRRGSGNSGGNFATASFNDLAGDGFAAAQVACRHPRIDPQHIGLYGISQGGWLAPLAAKDHRLIQFLIIVSGSGVSPAEQMNYAAGWTLEHEGYSREEIDLALHLRGMVDDYYRSNISRVEVAAHLDWYQHEPWFTSAYLPASEQLPEDVRMGKWYYELDYDPLPVWETINLPALFLYGESDRWVPVEESIRRYRQSARHNPRVRFETIPGANHMMENLSSGRETPDTSSLYQQVLLQWLRDVLQA